MAEVYDIAAIRAALGAQMERTGLRGKRLSKAAGLNESAVRDIMNKVEDPRIGTLLKLAHALKVSPSTLFGGTVELAGCITENGEIEPISACCDAPEFVPRPPEAVGELLAFKVEGMGLMPAYRHGDVVYVVRDSDNDHADYLGEECVVQLAGTGAKLFKTLAPGTKPDRFTLRAFNAYDLENVQLAWAAPVRFVRRYPPNVPIKDGG